MKDRYNARETKVNMQVDIRYMDAVHAVGVKSAWNIMNHKAIGMKLMANQIMLQLVAKEKHFMKDQ